MMRRHAWDLLHLLGRWSTGSIHKFSEELDVDPAKLLPAVRELQADGLLVAFPMKDNMSFENAMLEISQKGFDFIETHKGEISSST